MSLRPNRIIVAQYDAPKGLSLVAAAELIGQGDRAIAAQLVDFAVRRIVTIARPEGEGEGAGSGFTITLVDAAEEGVDEKAILVSLFGDQLAPGSTVTLNPGRNKELGSQLETPHRWIIARLVSLGWAREVTLVWKVMLRVLGHRVPVAPTPKSEPLVDHLWGIHDYVKLAERERFAFLQSPSGAKRRARLNALEVLVVNEKLLPYAVLFNLEKQWMRELDLRYNSLPPELAGDLNDVLAVTDVMVHGVSLVANLAELVDTVDAVNALDGVGAVFGGIGELVGSIDFPDFDFPDFG